VSTVRGCPFQCRYCFKVFGRNVRWRSVDNIVEEIKELKKRYGVQYVSFSDDLFTVNRTRVEEFCNRLIKENLGVKFLISARVNTVDEPLLKLLAKAGVVSLSYGIESANNDVLKSMNKMATKEMAHKAMIAARKAGIFANPSFMIGYPGETPQSIEETVKFCEGLGIATEFFYTTAYPGTPLYDQARAMGKIPDEDAYFESLGEMSQNLLINFTEMSDDELRRLKEEGNKRTRESQLGKLITIGKTIGVGKMANAALTRAVCKALRMMKQSKAMRKMPQPGASMPPGNAGDLN
jgi:anaerobic magnesium-protoporphyrin IX monomethyl ester cyclase